jgi:DNA-binding transcriptional MerR regulator
MKIGELAKLTDVSVDTLRFYEEKALLQPSGRTDAGYRHYDASAVEQVRFIKTAQRLGFSLQEILEVVPALVHGDLHLSEVRARMQTKLDALDQQIERLQQLRGELLLTMNLFKCEGSVTLNAKDLIQPV